MPVKPLLFVGYVLAVGSLLLVFGSDIGRTLGWLLLLLGVGVAVSRMFAYARDRTLYI